MKNSWDLWRLTWKVSLPPPLTGLFVSWLLSSHAPVHFIVLLAGWLSLLFGSTKYCRGGLEFPRLRLSLDAQ